MCRFKMSPTDTDTKQISAINNRRRNSCGRVEADSGRATEATRIYHFEVDLQVTGFPACYHREVVPMLGTIFISPGTILRV